MLEEAEVEVVARGCAKASSSLRKDNGNNNDSDDQDEREQCPHTPLRPFDFDFPHLSPVSHLLLFCFANIP